MTQRGIILWKFYGCTKCKAARGRVFNQPARRQTLPGGRPYQLYGCTKCKAARGTPDLQGLQLAAFLGTFDWQIFAPILHGFYVWRRSAPSPHAFDLQIFAPTPHPFGWQTIMFFICLTAERTLARHAYGWRIFACMHTLSTLLLHVFVMIMAGKDPLGS